MTYFVYILYSAKLARFYVGTTDNVEQRLEEHNSAKYSHSFTVKGIPWELFLKLECNSSENAYKLERFIKKMKSASFIRRLKTEPELLTSILKKY
jgi:putative endonuclease